MEFTAEAVDNEAGIIAGESCGSVMFPELNYGYDSAAVLVYLLSKLAEKNLNIDAAAATLPKYVMHKKAITASPAALYSAMNGLRTDMAKKKIKMDESDGVKINEKGGFLIIRPATLDNTIRIVAEAKTAAKANSLISLGNKLIKKYI
jgi:phosphomannomutase